MMTKTPIMRLPDFSKAFEVTCDTSGQAIGGVLSRKNHHIANFSENLIDAHSDTLRMTRNFMWLCRFCFTGGIICYRMSSFCIRIMKH